MKKILLGIAAFLVALAGGSAIMGSSRLVQAERTMLNEVATTTWSSAFSVADDRNLYLTVASTAATTTVQVACSFQDDAPTFSDTKSVTNRWDVVQVIDAEDASSDDGDTGIALAGSTDVRQFAVNTDNCKWIAVYNNWTSGTTTVMLSSTSNQ